MSAPSLAARLAIFDFDGTIADSLHEVLAAYNTVAGDLSIATVSSEQLAHLRALGPREVMRELEVPLWKVPKIMTAVRSALRTRMAQLKPFAGMIDTLHELSRRGLKMAIVSSNAEENVREFLVRHAIEHFEALSCGASLFGKAARLRRMARRPEFAGLEPFYVGDEVRDVTAAAEAGVRSVAVSWGYGEPAALSAKHPHHVVHTPAELLAILAPR